MATAATLTPHDVPTTLNYYAPVGNEAPFQYVETPPEGKPQNNIGLDPHPVVIQDARGRESEYSIDTTGFQFVKHVSAEKEFDDDERIKTVYYKEVEELLKREVGAKRVYIFDHTISGELTMTTIGSFLTNAPSKERVHIDQTFDASVKRVHYHLGDEADRLLKGRVRIINVWRPIHHPVAHKPLAVSDWRYLDTEHDLVSVRFIYPHREGSTFSVRYNPDHHWYYLSNQTPEEVTLIKCYDSEVDRARLTPHSAFPDPTSSPEAPHRESIEIRCLVFDTE
ncbi:uncharacterized protein LAESUDRAFT_647013 [Laetiporus sulphureus 93-53]|uniref:Methyltransferase n=1 Tax=Laetiporus sulphureus 93-53 TaxID=1314785 RepID=A0A165FTF6_9APHY|nr:uncharacterized protein LAESUDRAFT_647013 [Laetiporus sulphureus 93-53]KZT09387.1 hypothetical protein LAESUDRAFT_647013 [Laetiporus sulphureus 93-53]